MCVFLNSKSLGYSLLTNANFLTIRNTESEQDVHVFEEVER
jgi:hypothetical protein